MKDTSKVDRNVREERLSQLSKSVGSLRDLPLELRKKEASKPIYLTRYE